MTVEELIYELQELDGEAEVRLAMQPSYPMEHNIRGVVQVELQEDGRTRPVVFISEMGGNNYLASEVCEELGW